VHALIQVLLDGIVLGGFYALAAQGLSLIFGIMRIINLAHGEFLILGAYLTWAAREYLGIDPLLALPFLILIGFAVGWLVCRLIVIPVAHRHELMPLLVTFGLAGVIQGGLTLVFSATPKLTNAAYSDSVASFFGWRVSAANGIMLIGALILLGLLSLFVNRTKLGKAMKAVAQNRTAARIVGIGVTRVHCAAFGVGTALAFAAGGLFGTSQGFYPFMGALFTLKAFVIVVLGGGGRLGGALAAAMFIGLVESVLSGYVPEIGTSLGTAAAFILVVAVLVVRPQGISRVGVAKA
jgi:branched-chain amino acid transport system permease protein